MTKTGEVASPSPQNRAADDRVQRRRALLREAGLVGLPVVLLVAFITAIFAVAVPAWVPKVPELRIVLTEFEGPLYTGDQPSARFTVENRGSATASNCVLRWSPASYLATITTPKFMVRVNTDFVAPLKSSEEMVASGTVQQVVRVECDDGVSAEETETVEVYTRISPSPEPAAPGVLTEVATCSPSTPVQVAERLTSLGVVVVDGRCDSAPSAPVGIYPRPERGADEAIGAVSTGAQLEAICATTGETTQDLAENRSDRWIRVRFNDVDAYVPAVWTRTGALDLC